jgi:ribose transport system substrate-binding protein
MERVIRNAGDSCHPRRVGSLVPNPASTISRAVAWVCPFALVIGATSCGPGVGSHGSAARDTVAARDGGKRIGVTLLTKEQEFYRQLEGGLRREAAAKGFRLLITSGDFDLARQQAEIDNFVVQRVDAIIVCPVDSKGIGPAIERAEAAGIPVFTADIRAYGVSVASHVTSDSRDGGRQAAAFMARAIGGRGTVGIIGQAETQTGYDRAHAFMAALARYPQIRVVGELNGGGVRDRALKVAEDMLQAHPDLSGIFAINDEMALGALAAARARGRTAADFTIVGFDADSEAIADIRGHTPLKADIVQHPDQIGVGTIDAIAKHFARQPIDSLVTIPVVTLDASAAGPLTTTP